MVSTDPFVEWWGTQRLKPLCPEIEARRIFEAGMAATSPEPERVLVPSTLPWADAVRKLIVVY